MAYIDTPDANAALAVAARLAQRTSAELRLYTVVADEAGDGRARPVVRRETWDDLLARDVAQA